MPVFLILLSLGLAASQALAREPAVAMESDAGYVHADQASAAVGVRSAVRDYGTAALGMTGRAESGTMTALTEILAKGAAVPTGRERRAALASRQSLRLLGPTTTQTLTFSSAATYDSTEQLLEPFLDQRALASLTKSERQRLRTADASYAGTYELSGRDSLSLDLYAGGQSRGFIVRNQSGAIFWNAAQSSSLTWRLGLNGWRQNVGRTASATYGPEAVASLKLSPLTAVDLRGGYRQSRMLGAKVRPAETNDAGASLRYDDERTKLMLSFQRSVAGAAASADVDGTQTMSIDLAHRLTRRARLSVAARQARSERLTGVLDGTHAQTRAAEFTYTHGFGAPRVWKSDEFGQTMQVGIAREDLIDPLLGGGRRLSLRCAYTSPLF